MQENCTHEVVCFLVLNHFPEVVCAIIVDSGTESNRKITYATLGKEKDRVKDKKPSPQRKHMQVN